MKSYNTQLLNVHCGGSDRREMGNFPFHKVWQLGNGLCCTQGGISSPFNLVCGVLQNGNKPRVICVDNDGAYKFISINK